MLGVKEALLVRVVEMETLDSGTWRNCFQAEVAEILLKEELSAWIPGDSLHFGIGRGWCYKEKLTGGHHSKGGSLPSGEQSIAMCSEC